MTASVIFQPKISTYDYLIINETWLSGPIYHISYGGN